METFTWGPHFDVGDDKINREHQKLIAMMRNLAQLCKKSVPKQQVLFAYDALIQFTEEHFADEEELMAELNYPDLENHKKIHQQLLDNLYKYREELVVSVYGVLPSSVFDFFQNWLMTHILIVDQKYGAVLKEKKKTPSKEN